MSLSNTVFFWRKALIVGVLVASATSLFAQKKDKPSIPLDHFYADPINTSGLRALLSKLHFGLSMGYGRTFYKQHLDEFGILQRQDSVPVIFRKDLSTSGNTLSSGYTYFFNRIEGQDNITYNPATDFIVNNDTAAVDYAAVGHSLPITATLHVEIGRYKIGGGAMFEYHRPGTFQPTAYEERIGGIRPDFGSVFYKKYFGFIGAKVYRYRRFVVAVDAQIGAFKLTDKFDKSLIQKGAYINIGTTIERELSEYLSAFVRPSFDYKNFSLNLPESDVIIDHSMNALYIGVGLTYRIPELRKCFIKNCTTQINHQHGNKVYRSRMHPFYKKQDPHHGENYPRLIKYKRKNRRKLNPY